MSNHNSTLTAERLRELFIYTLDTGMFVNRINRSPRAMTGMVAGSLTKDGYLVIRIDRAIYKAHRLAWLYVHGVWPSNLLDHKNRIKVDNRIDNLRLADKTLNGQNKVEAQANNKLGRLGVTLHFDGHYRATIQHENKQRHIGLFDTPEEASAAYEKAKTELHADAILVKESETFCG